MNGSGTNPTRVPPGEFVRQVRQEIAKVTWPSRKETLITTAMVFLMSILAAVFFFIIDNVAAFVIRQIVG
jgi:preprotein translocase subunit SecE